MKRQLDRRLLLKANRRGPLGFTFTVGGFGNDSSTLAAVVVGAGESEKSAGYERAPLPITNKIVILKVPHLIGLRPVFSLKSRAATADTPNFNYAGRSIKCSGCNIRISGLFPALVCGKLFPARPALAQRSNPGFTAGISRPCAKTHSRRSKASSQADNDGDVKAADLGSGANCLLFAANLAGHH